MMMTPSSMRPPQGSCWVHLKRFFKKISIYFFSKTNNFIQTKFRKKKEIQPKCWWSVTFVLGDKVSQSGIWKLIGQGEMFECMRFLCWTFYANHRMACNGPHESVASTFSPCLIYDHVDSARSLNYLHLFLSRKQNFNWIKVHFIHRPLNQLHLATTCFFFKEILLPPPP